MAWLLEIDKTINICIKLFINKTINHEEITIYNSNIFIVIHITI